MSQNTPSSNNQGEQGSAPNQEELAANPYYNNVQADAPDLDAAAPTLRSAEDQRLNRKALFFLGGIVLLLVAMGFLVFRKSQKDEEEPKRESQAARSAIPAAPSVQTAPELPAQTKQEEPVDFLPVLPSNQQQMPPSFGSRNSEMSEPTRDRGPTLLERRMASTGQGMGDLNAPTQDGSSQQDSSSAAMYKSMMERMPGGQQQNAERVKLGPDVDDVSSARFINHPDALLVRGTYLRCVLETRIITDVPGFTSCLLTEPVYSINGRSLLLPKGSKIYGAYGGGPTGKRVSVIWDRITTPNGIDVAMSSPGVDQLGGAGHPGQYSAHWGSRITSALMISMLADIFKYAAAESGPETTTITGNGLAIQQPYESATARTMERLAGQALEENMRRPPTVTINQGVVVNVYVAKDVDFSSVLTQRN
ncbi:type IV secretion system protein VirB10 [Xanthomonas arboricola]|uniref:TrbI/VirB10 family protein n=1 Tax=Xanthomonas campestris TaxID=339 RepID=UPI002167C4E6|nr:TrbI/VirB10 family protein [Xanthomonas campestris]MCS3848991.1 type IV secretion system protein VirB10 [Xanthomonas campestris]MCW2005002.1 type IV secretion system protein VirB10 [Xanthomonas campestris]